MFSELKLYFHFIKVYISAMTEYRFAFFIETISNMINIGSFYVFLTVVFNQISTIAGWSYNEALFLVSINWLCTSISGFFFWTPSITLSSSIKDGSFDSYLTRPICPLKFIIYRQFQYTFIGRLILSMFFLLKSILSMNIEWSAGKSVFLIISIICGALIHGALLLIMGSLSFWLIDNTEIMNLITSYDGVRTLIDFPLSAFTHAIQVFFTFVVPYAFVNYYPAVYILDKVNTDSIFSPMIVYMSPVATIIVIAIALIVWNLGLRRYNSSGS